ncbi:MAG: gamma-glutamylcyclotransferase [Gammaproteobacteria bacterium]|jgi:gamma-glutamylcyclotransferase (GGCT)/AIG2-like uncharacterized protein YtfP
MPVRLFCYGTLMVPAVWLKVVGRPRDGADAWLEDYACRQVRGECFPGLLPKAGARTPGIVYRGLSQRDLECLDRFEGGAYERRLVPVQLASGDSALAWCFVTRKPYRRRLSKESWSRRDFVSAHLNRYLASGRVAGVQSGR